MIKTRFLILFFFVLTLNLFSQSAKYIVDKDSILIGQQIRFTVELNDFELIGIPYAIIVGSKEAEKSITTIMTRKNSSKTSVNPEDIFKIISGK